jgi:hypothetical protein
MRRTANSFLILASLLGIVITWNVGGLLAASVGMLLPVAMFEAFGLSLISNIGALCGR